MIDRNIVTVAALTARVCDSGYKPLGFSSYHKLLANMATLRVQNPYELYRLSYDGVYRLCGNEDTARRICGLLGAKRAVTQALERIVQQGITVLGMDEPDYPNALLKKIPTLSPPLIFCVGNTALLNRRSLAAIGSRGPTERAAAFAARLGEQAAQAGLCLVSGGASGCDTIAERAATASGGSAVLYLAKPLAATAAEPRMKRLIEQGRLCLVSDHDPFGSFTGYGAMYRNQYIYAASEAAFVCESRAAAGGSYKGALSCLQRGYGSVYAYNNPECLGNQMLIGYGAKPVEFDEKISI